MSSKIRVVAAMLVRSRGNIESMDGALSDQSQKENYKVRFHFTP